MTQYEKRYANFFYKFSKLIEIYKSENYSKIIFLCIGTSKVIGDSFGPLVGNKLKREIHNNNIIILGDLEENISALNLYENLKFINNKYNKPFIISVDAALSRKEDIGKINVYPYGIKIRNALEENHNRIGNLSIKAIVANNNKKSIENYLELMNTPKSRIEYLSDITAKAIKSVIEYSNV